MGSRSNVVLILEKTTWKRFQKFHPEGYAGRRAQPSGVQPSPALWLYSHYGGECFRDERAATALLAAEPRWDDPEYAARIIIDSIYSNLRDQETGGGIGFGPCDNGYDVRVIHFPSRKTWLVKADSIYDDGPNNNTPVPGSTQTFEEFAKGAPQVAR